MRTISTKIYRAIQNGKTIHISLDAVSESEMGDHFARKPELPISIEQDEIDIPVVKSDIVMWDGGDGFYPHLHFNCPRCSIMHNVDLEENDQSPRFGCCDSCGWDSPVWLEWNEKIK